MKKSLITALVLAGSTCLAGPAMADSGLVDIKLKVDHSQPTAVIYKQVQKKADRTCGRDDACAEALTDALIEAIADEELTEFHKAQTSKPASVQVASAS